MDEVQKAKPRVILELVEGPDIGVIEAPERSGGTTADRLKVVCATKGIELKQVKQVEWNEDDIFLTLEDATRVRVEISSLPAGLLESSVPVPETTQVQPSATTTRIIKLKRREPPAVQVVDATLPPAKAAKKRRKRSK